MKGLMDDAVAVDKLDYIQVSKSLPPLCLAWLIVSCRAWASQQYGSALYANNTILSRTPTLTCLRYRSLLNSPPATTATTPQISTNPTKDSVPPMTSNACPRSYIEEGCISC